MLFMMSGKGQAPTADSVLKEACSKAANQQKKVMVIFHASWCGWCQKMDASLNDSSIKPFFDKNFVITHLTID
jgi:thioredoxin-related protein